MPLVPTSSALSSRDSFIVDLSDVREVRDANLGVKSTTGGAVVSFQVIHSSIPASPLPALKRPYCKRSTIKTISIGNINLNAQDLSYIVKHSTKKEEIHLLRGVSGFLMPGQLCALMGPSGVCMRTHVAHLCFCFTCAWFGDARVCADADTLRLCKPFWQCVVSVHAFCFCQFVFAIFVPAQQRGVDRNQDRLAHRCINYAFFPQVVARQRFWTCWQAARRLGGKRAASCLGTPSRRAPFCNRGQDMWSSRVCCV